MVLNELPVDARGPILRELPRQVPHGVQFFGRLHGLPLNPDAFAAAAPLLPVFQVKGTGPARRPAGHGV